MEEMEGAGQPKRKGTKEVTIHCGRWEDEKIGPEVLQPGVGVPPEGKDPIPPPGSVHCGLGAGHCH